MGRQAAVSLIAVATLFASGSDPSSTQALGRLPFQTLLNADGSGRVFMNNGSTPLWKACRPDLTACSPFATGNFDTGNAPPETVFWAGENLVTPIWKGDLRQARPPSVQGRVRGNEVVIPVAGLWTGGWEDDYDDLALSICKAAVGKNCLQINDEGREEEECGARGAALIDPAFAGRYLRVVDRRYSSNTLFAGIGHPDYYPIAEIKSEATTSIAVVGKIAPATGPPSIDCGPPPLTNASISDDGSAEVTCQIVRCRVALTARRGKRTARLKRSLPPTPLAMNPRSTKLRLAPSSIEHLEGSPIWVTVKINGRTAARRTVRVGRLPLVVAYPARSPEATGSALAKPEIRVGLNPDGSGSLAAEPPGAWEWKNCTTDLTGCTPVGTGTQVSTAGFGGGTVFTATLDGRTLVSPPWNGNVYFVEPPSLRGTVRANEYVAPLSGDWRGGWPEQIGLTQIAACPGSELSDCITLSSYPFACASGGSLSPGGTVIDSVLTGWNLRLAEQVQILGSGPLYGDPQEEPAFPESAVSSVVPLGQIAPAIGPRMTDCGVPPQFQASISKAGVATVRCGLGCHATLTAKRGGRTVKTARDLAPMLFRLRAASLPRLRLPYRLLRHIGAGRTQMTISLNEQRLARRIVHLRDDHSKNRGT